MAEQFNTIIASLSAGLLAAFGWVFRRHAKRHEDTEARVSELEKTSCSKDDLQAFGLRLETTITQGTHEIREELREARARIDGLYKR